VKGKLECGDDGQCSIIAEAIEDLDRLPQNRARALIIEITDAKNDALMNKIFKTSTDSRANVMSGSILVWETE
jgi:hypothetical protein